MATFTKIYTHKISCYMGICYSICVAAAHMSVKCVLYVIMVSPCMYVCVSPCMYVCVSPCMCVCV